MIPWVRALVSGRRDRGFPTSANRASSFHLWWVPATEAKSAAVTLEITAPPVVDRLYFWALQVSFVADGVRTGGAHLGLQWNPLHPASRAVNWGGYDEAGNVLTGTESELPSASGNPNTRDYAWQPFRPYRLEIVPGKGIGWWRGAVTDLETGSSVRVRELAGGGARLTDHVVWSEVFARCDDPSAAVRWTDPEVESDSGIARPTAYRVGFQPLEQGGCTNTSVEAGTGVVQATNRLRRHRSGDLIPTG